MTQQKTTRKLRAILSADVKGYSLLMSDDEAFTIHTLKEYRNIMSSCIEQYTGRIVDSPGDNVLAEFASAVDAVQCAVEIQRQLKKENDRLVEDKRLEFRIGVNIGDVVQDGERIYGSGVNVAARIEGLADAGGICVSRNAYDHVKDKLELGFEYLGEHEVKNIKEPVRVYRLLLDVKDAGKLIGEVKKPPTKKWLWVAVAAVAILAINFIWQLYHKTPSAVIEPASLEKMAFPLPEKPSIAVLPFDNLSGDPEDEFIADGISESIITALSKIPGIFVIARNSTFTYKGKAVKIQEVAEDLSVQYVLEGSLQKSKDQLRINAQLIDAINGKHLWAEKYDRNMKDTFVLQDDITMKIITALNVKLTQGERISVYDPGTDNLEAYLKIIKGYHYIDIHSKEGNAIMKKMATEAISLDPNYPGAYLLLSISQSREVLLGTTNSPTLSLMLSTENAQKAISLDNSFVEAQAFLGTLYTIMQQYERGIAAAEASLALNPNSAEAYKYLGFTLNYSGQCEDAIKMYNKAIRMNPIHSVDTSLRLCISLRNCGRYEEGILAGKKAIHPELNNLYAHTCLASCYALLDRDAEAKAESAEVMRIDPKFSVSNLRTLPYKDIEDTMLIVNSLLKAGLPD